MYEAVVSSTNYAMTSGAAFGLGALAVLTLVIASFVLVVSHVAAFALGVRRQRRRSRLV